MEDLLQSPWLLVSFIFIFLELFFARRILFFLGVACLGVALTTEYLQLKSLESEIKVFIAYSLFSLGVLRYVTRKISPVTIIETTFKKESKLYGKYGVVVETIKVAKKGRVKIGKRIFLAKTKEKSDIKMGEEIKISGKDKRCFIVERNVNRVFM